MLALGLRPLPRDYSSSKPREDAVAGLFAATAGLGAHPAVLVVRGVLFALISTQLACLRAGLERERESRRAQDLD